MPFKKDLQSSQRIRDLLSKLLSKPAFIMKFSSFNEYIEYRMKGDLEFMNKNPNKPL